MIIVKIWGGIGNQLFQYVFGQYLHYRYGQEVCYDNNSYYSVDKLRKSELDALSNGDEIVYDNRCSFSKFRGVKNRLLRFAFQAHPRHHYIVEGGNIPHTFRNNHLYFFQGYWQDIKYYEWLKENVPDFRLQSKLWPEELEGYLKEITNELHSASLHVRRGDYFLPENVKTFGVCDVEYFKHAIEFIRKMEPQSKIFVFSDDLDWVKKNLQMEGNFEVIENYNVSPFYYIELMSWCKHHIISNSSFSWWAAVMNETEGGIVACPSRWLLNNDMNIALDKWHKIDI